jgi:hypothetical protein
MPHRKSRMDRIGDNYYEYIFRQHGWLKLNIAHLFDKIREKV